MSVEGETQIPEFLPKSLCGAKHRFQNFWNKHRISVEGETHIPEFLEHVRISVWR
jgi:hypothetical protein